MTTRDPELQRLLDRQAISDCLHRYSRGIDRHDEELLGSAFHPDAVDHHGEFVGPPEVFVPWANELHESEWQSHTHFLDVNLVEIDGDKAHTITYCLWVLRRQNGEGVDLGGGRYLDQLEKRDGDWRITQRELVIDWLAHADEIPRAASGVYPTGTWDKSDPSYARPFRLSV